MFFINVGTILGRIVVAFGIFIAVLSFIKPEEAMKIMTFGGDILMSIALAGLLIGSILCVMVPTMLEMEKNEKLMKKGKLTKLKILKVQKSLYTTGGLRYVKLTIKTVNGNKAGSMLFVPKKKIPNAGDEIQCLYDPADPTVISAMPPDTDED